MTAQFELFHYWRSSCSWRVRWALELKQISYKSTPVNLLKGEHREPAYLAKNPSGLVPTLKVQQSFYTESLAILEWLEEKYPQPYSLLPLSPEDRVRVRELTYAIACGIQPIQNLKVLQYTSSDQKRRVAFARHWIEEGFRGLEVRMANTAGSFSYGSQITMADLCLVPQVYNALRFNIDMSKYPTIFQVHSNCLKTKECERAAPQNQPGAIP